MICHSGSPQEYWGGRELYPLWIIGIRKWNELLFVIKESIMACVCSPGLSHFHISFGISSCCRNFFRASSAQFLTAQGAVPVTSRFCQMRLNYTLGRLFPTLIFLL